MRREGGGVGGGGGKDFWEEIPFAFHFPFSNLSTSLG